MPAPALAAALAVAGALLVVAGSLALRASGARVGLGRRLAGARQVRIADVIQADTVPARPVRVSGRIRCADPIVTTRDDRLVAYHRDVEVLLPGVGWRQIERLRESREFELWDHAGALRLDPAAAAEPLIVIPHVWRGSPGELGDAHRPAVERLAAEHGPPTEARSVSRGVSVVDRLLVLARVERDPDGRLALRPPSGGYLVAAVELDEAMRLLGGDRRLLVGGAAAIGLGALGLATAVAFAIGAVIL